MKYPKIQTLWKRDKNNKFKIIPGRYTLKEFETIRYWQATEKLDGTNIRIYFSFGGSSDPLKQSPVLEFRGRTDKAEIPPFLLEYLQKTFTIDKMMEAFPKLNGSICLYGEGIGNKIQKVGKLYTSGNKFVLFDVLINGWWGRMETVNEIAASLDIDYAPFLGIDTIESMVSYVKGKPDSIYGNYRLPMEGVVCRSYPLMLFRNENPIMFKLKVKDYEALKI